MVPINSHIYKSFINVHFMLRKCAPEMTGPRWARSRTSVNWFGMEFPWSHNDQFGDRPWND